MKKSNETSTEYICTSQISIQNTKPMLMSACLASFEGPSNREAVRMDRRRADVRAHQGRRALGREIQFLQPHRHPSVGILQVLITPLALVLLQRPPHCLRRE